MVEGDGTVVGYGKWEIRKRVKAREEELV